MRLMRSVTAMALVGALVGCSALQEDKTQNWSAEQLFNEARAEKENGNFTTASDYYSKFLTRFPYGAMAQQSALELAYSQQQDGESQKALETIENFIRTYPNHEYIDYAYYLRGIIAYERNLTFFKRVNPVNLAQTDPKILLRAFESFEVLVNKYPQSEYSEDARYRMLYLKNLMGQHELEVALHYLRTGAYLAAIQRAQGVVVHFEQTPSTPYALAVIARAYQELGDERRSGEYRQVLEHNFSEEVRSDEEVQRLLRGDIKLKNSLWQWLTTKPKV
ncbi:MAG: outer membrane protein assembly factor BamD [Cardiobacteriaceae bacterium]|nr:outer membrane protein assembly factor BamD [Cardiobacteriaceae bacterium]